MRSISPSRVLPLACAALMVSCSGGGTTTPTTTETMAKNTGDAQSAPAGTAVAVRPSVKITDQNNAAVAGVSVTFAVASGGGSAGLATTTTGSDGVATVGSWTLGTTAGANTLTASASGVTGSPVTFTATGTAVTPVIIMAKSSGDAQTGAAGAAVPITPAVVVENNAGGTLTPVAGVAVTFAVASGGGSITGATTTTNAQGIATVGSWTLGATAGANTLTASASGITITSGNPATFTATGAANFSPTSNTTLAGTQLVGSVNIPAGVTVTMTGDVTLNVIGAVNIAGTLTGCFNLTINADGALTSTGSINNSCSPAPAPAPARARSPRRGGYISGGTITTSGAILIENDASLTDATFGTSVVAPHSGTAAALHQAGGTCNVGPATFVASPATAKAGTDGQFGTNGTDGATWVLQCTGELDVNGGLSVFGQNGGPGGNGSNTSATAASATGGNGGKGGVIKVRANNGNLLVNGSGNNIQSGNGGNGGTANATGTATGNPGASATATGGNGNAPGNIVLQSLGGGITVAAVTLTVGSGGNGGSGTATAANGQDATPCQPGVGGAATATGGSGGATPDKTLTATGSVTGVAGVTVAGGVPGTGGGATSTGGNGGGGAETCKTGGNGGAVAATGGVGGSALLKDQNGVLIANGGNGGLATWIAAIGGQGWNDCGAVAESGGNGGIGGAVGGGDGNGGTGKANGQGGGGTYNVVSNGGNGGSGSGPGNGGAAGANNTILHKGPGTTIQPSFVAGSPGSPCHPQVNFKYSAIQNTSGSVTAAQSVPLQDSNTGLDAGGSVTLTPTGQVFVATDNNPQPRVGIGPNGDIKVKVSGATVNGAKYVVTSAQLCVVNAPLVSPSNAIVVVVKNAAGTTEVGQTIGSQTCQTVTMPSDADIIEWFGPVGADFIFYLFGHAP
jgi:hypothetical protein